MDSCSDENRSLFLSGGFCSGEDGAPFLSGGFCLGGHRESVAFLGKDEDTSWSIIGSLLGKDGAPSWRTNSGITFLSVAVGSSLGGDTPVSL